MKKFLLSIVLLVAGYSVSMAQSASSAFSSGDNLFSVGIGIGTPYLGSGYSTSLPVNPTISYEKGITDAISVGGTLSYASSKYGFNDGYGDAYSFKESLVYVGVSILTSAVISIFTAVLVLVTLWKRLATARAPIQPGQAGLASVCLRGESIIFNRK
jgi:hypothetical protein